MGAVITGVGYIGSALLRRLVERGDRVVGLENFYCTPRASLDSIRTLPGFAFLEGDVAEPGDVARALDRAMDDRTPLTIFHLAAQPSATIAARDPAITERTNLVGSRVLLEAARQRDARVVFGGSFRVYGDDLAGTVDESAPYGRVDDLAHLSKLYVEQLALTLGTSFVSVRLGVVYGHGPVMKTDPPFMTVGNLFAWRAAREEPLQVTQDRPVAFVHVADAADALLCAAASPDMPAWQVANAVSEVVTIGEVAHLVQRLARERGREVRVLGASDGNPPAFRVTSRLTSMGWRTKRSLTDGLAESLDAFLRNQW